MAIVKPFYHHTQTVTGIMAAAPEPERYPYHDDDQCPVGQQVKASDEWQYYRDEPGRERDYCPMCAELAAPTAGRPAARPPVPAGG
ncbi:hypothetical protein [uncultured Hymenobacter sp.]|uniref:hypothetical protein n=1 Tax=uncultured Hymenobacter sp. TaxID=170016 RepID=UPI0035CB24AA